jgi:putative ABC transport system permease protein
MIHTSEIKQIFRSLFRKKLLNSINILGLGIGLGSVILLTTFLIHEFSFDRYHSKSSRIYRIVAGKNCGTYYAMGEAFKREIPEINKVCRIVNMSVFTVILRDNNEGFPINSFMATDPTLFDMLDIEMLQQQSKDIGLAPGSVIISDKTSKKYFGNANPVGKNMEFFIANEEKMLQITGVYKNPPSNSSFQAEFICDISLAMAQFKDLGYSLGLTTVKSTYDFYNNWDTHGEFMSFVLLNKKADVASVEKKCTELYLKHRGELADGGIHLQPYKEMYLHSEGLERIQALKISRFESLRIFLSIGFLILFVACMNYILLSSSEQEQSFTEIACRKVNGASAGNIIAAVMFKSFFISFISLVPAVLFVKLSMPIFNGYFEKELDFSLFFKWQYFGALFLITALTAAIAGAYLSITALKASPVGLLQKNKQSKRSSWMINNGLVIVKLYGNYEKANELFLKKGYGVRNKKFNGNKPGQ